MSDQPTDSTDTEPAADAATSGSGRGWRIAAGIAVVAAFVSIGVLGALLFGGSGSGVDGDVRACIIDPGTRDFTKDAQHEKPPNCPPEGAKQSDGLVKKTNEGGFTMQELEGGRPGGIVELYVREPDLPYIDIAHARTHAALGQPIRVYTLEVDGKESVVYMEDAPLLG